MKKVFLLSLIVFSNQFCMDNPDDWVSVEEAEDLDEWVVVERNPKKNRRKRQLLSTPSFSPSVKQEENEIPIIFDEEDDLPNEAQGLIATSQNLTTSQEYEKTHAELWRKIKIEQQRTLQSRKRSISSCNSEMVGQNKNIQDGVTEFIIQCLNWEQFETLRKRKAIPITSRNQENKETELEWFPNPQELLHQFDNIKTTCAIKKIHYYRTQFIETTDKGRQYEAVKVNEPSDEACSISAMQLYFPFFMHAILKHKQSFGKMARVINENAGLQARNITFADYKRRLQAENERLEREYKARPRTELMEESGRQRSGSYHAISTEIVERKPLLEVIKSMVSCFMPLDG